MLLACAFKMFICSACVAFANIYCILWCSPITVLNLHHALVEVYLCIHLQSVTHKGLTY